MRLIMNLIMRVLGHYEPLETPNLIMIVSLIIRCIMRLLAFQCTYLLLSYYLLTALQVGMVFVGIAIVLYGHVAKTPEQSYRACVGCLCPTAGR